MKLEALKKKLETRELGTVIGPFEIHLDSIRKDPTMQVRDKLDDGNKKRLRSAYRSGSDVPPITIAFIEGDDQGPVVIDGHHRVTALETLVAEGHKAFSKVRAKVQKLSREQARYQAAIANNTHGLQLKPKETRRLFNAYVLAAQHKDTKDSFKSYRQIGKDLARDHKTVAKWMREDFPKEAAKMEQLEKTNTGGEGAPAPKVLIKHDVEKRLLEWRVMFEEAYSADRTCIIEGMESLLLTFKEMEVQKSPLEHDESIKQAEQERHKPKPEDDF